MFRRRRKDSDQPAGPGVPDEAPADEERNDAARAAVGERGGAGREAVSEQAGEAVGERGGPWDVADEPPEHPTRVDLGGLRIPVLAGVELRLDAGPAGEVLAAVLLDGASALQVGAFAAPRGEGLWAEVRAELLSSIRQQGGSATEREGPFGTEIQAKLVAEQGRQTVRFVGIDGPRWFVRGMFSGPAATNLAQAGLLERSLREMVVVRGEDPMPVRDPIPLTMPAEALADQPPPADGAAEADRLTVDLPRRGPEITETR